MVSLFKTYKTRTEDDKIYSVVELRGLSTDSKPKVLENGVNVDNGSVYIAIDTQAVYMYDATSTGSWVTPE